MTWMRYPRTEPTGADAARSAADATVMTNHRVVRNGSLWSCTFCRAAWPFPSPIPQDTTPCVLRLWGDQ